MKNLICDMPKIALAALILGVFSTNPLAHAGETALTKGDFLGNASAKTDEQLSGEEDAGDEEDSYGDAQRAGMKQQEIANLPGDFKIKVVGDQLVFEGSMPEKCAKDATMSEVNVSKAGEIGIQIDMPACMDNPKFKKKKEKMVSVKEVFASRTLPSDVDGKICLLNAAVLGDDLACDPVTGLDPFKSAKTRAEELAKKEKDEAEQKKKDEAAERQRKADAIINKVKELCRKGDFETLTKEIEAMAQYLGDVTEILAKVEEFKTQRLIGNLSNAKDSDAARKAYGELIAASIDNDTEENKNLYLDRRFEIVKDVIANSELKHAEIALEIRSYATEIAAVGMSNKDRKAQVAWGYAELAGKLKEEGELDSAAGYYDRAMDYLDSRDIEGRKNIEIAMTNMYHDAIQACLEENKLTPAKCDKLADKAKKHLDKAIAQQKRMKKSTDALADLQALQVKKIQTFGLDAKGTTMNIKNQNTPFGQMNYGMYQRYPGSYGARKAQMFNEGRNEAYMEYMMQRNSGLPYNNGGATGEGNGTGLSF